jgi:recombination protein RecA
MSSPAIHRLETLLDARKLAGTLRQTDAPARAGAAATGWAWLDRALGGGWPRGEISELVGPPSSGRTTVLAATFARATREGELVALVDAADRFDPVSAFAAGVVLSHVLWVRGPALTGEEARGSVRDRAITQAVRACDLIIRAGGFSVVALDVADLAARTVRSLPWTTWMRLAHANEGGSTACVIVGAAHIARSARGVSLPLTAERVWVGTSAQMRRFAGLDSSAAVLSTARARVSVTAQRTYCGVPPRAEDARS